MKKESVKERDGNFVMVMALTRKRKEYKHTMPVKEVGSTATVTEKEAI